MNDKNQNSLKNEKINNNDIETLIDLIVTTSENANTPNHQESLYKLLQQEENEIKLTSNLLTILSNFNQCINRLSSLQNLTHILKIQHHHQAELYALMLHNTHHYLCHTPIDQEPYNRLL